jgi:hypothetical protein
MMIFARSATRNFKTEDWIAQAIGEPDDEYGIPFEAIQLRFRPDGKRRAHGMAEYAKIRGFEDTEIYSRSDGMPAVRHLNRGNGSAMFIQSGPGVGPFIAILAKTPYNMNKLASMYGDKRYAIVDPMVDAEVRGMYERRIAGMSEEEKDFHEQRVKALHTRHTEQALPTPEPKEDVIDQNDLREERRKIMEERVALAKLKAELEKQKKQVAEKTFEAAKEGDLTVPTVDVESLPGMTRFQLMKLARSLGAPQTPTAKKDEVIAAIKAKMGVGAEQPVVEIEEESVVE